MSFRRKVVTTGVRDGQLRVIESGLSPTDWVVTEGVQRAFPGAKVDPQRGQLASAAPEPSRRGQSRRGRSGSEMNPEGRAGAISRFFINRPVLANVLALVFILIGLVSLLQLPSSQYPNVVPPTVQVTTRYPGASAMTLVDTVALPIEQNVNGVENMIYMQSTSASDGTYSLIVTFAIGTNPDEDEILVQNRVSAAISSLPVEVQLQGVTTKKQSTSILEFVGLTSPDSRFDSLFLANYAVINVQDELRRLPGVGDVSVLGAGQYAMRVWLNPDLLAGAGIDAAGRHQRHPAAEPGGLGGTDRRAARSEGAGFSIYARPQGSTRRSEGIREHHRQGRFGQRRPHHQDSRHRPR